MQERHSNRQLYFNEQAETTEKFVIPYINSVKKIDQHSIILEVGCGEGGNLKPFLDLSCRCVGIDIIPEQITLAKEFFKNHKNGNSITFIAQDIYQVHPDQFPKFDVIFLRDVIEHIPNQEKFMTYIKKFIAHDGVIFFGFPPWHMPFGGHQQVCRNPILAKLPYFHLLPDFIYSFILKLGKESQELIDGLLEVKSTGIGISRFDKCLINGGLKEVKRTYYLINPNYQTKFGLKPRILPVWLNIPRIRDFYTTAVYSVCKIR